MADRLRTAINDVERLIKDSSKVFICGHEGPDFDAIGSSIGLSELAYFFDRDSYIIVDDEQVKLEPGVKRIIDENKEYYNIIDKNEALSLIDENSLLILTDVNKDNMILISDILDKFKDIYIIDHHSINNHTIKTNSSFISEEVSSASEIVARMLLFNRVDFGEEVANFLLAGISLDTTRFKKNTTDRTHDVAEKLIKHGAKIDYVNSLFFEEFDSFCRISNLIIQGTTIEKYSKSLIAPIQVSFTLNRNSPKAVYLKEDLAKASDKMMKFNGIDASFALGYVDDEYVHISARSERKVDVGTIMNSLGGGGNHQSAGAKIKIDDIFELENKLKQNISLGISDEEDIIEEPKVIKVKQLRRKNNKEIS